MGLDVSHNCWSGAYSRFYRFRIAIAQAAGLGDPRQYEGWGGETPWPPHPVVPLLNHSDCDGEIAADECAPLADALEPLIEKLSGEEDFAKRLRLFVDGLRTAAAAGEAVEFA